MSTPRGHTGDWASASELSKLQEHADLFVVSQWLLEMFAGVDHPRGTIRVLLVHVPVAIQTAVRAVLSAYEYETGDDLFATAVHLEDVRGVRSPLSRGLLGVLHAYRQEQARKTARDLTRMFGGV